MSSLGFELSVDGLIAGTMLSTRRARVPIPTVKAVKTTAFDLQLNPANPGMSFLRRRNRDGRDLDGIPTSELEEQEREELKSEVAEDPDRQMSRQWTERTERARFGTIGHHTSCIPR